MMTCKVGLVLQAILLWHTLWRTKLVITFRIYGEFLIKSMRMRQRLSEEEYNKLSVKLELQADFLAGVWAHHDQAIK